MKIGDLEELNYEAPEELDFLEREFGLSDEHHPEEAMFSYIHRYENDLNLIFTHSPFSNNSMSVKLIHNRESLFYHYQEGVSSIVFQGWDDDKIIRVYFKNDRNIELRIAYLPKPKLYFSEF